MSASNPILVKRPKSRITAHLHSFIPRFSPPLEQTTTHSSIPLFPPGLQNGCSPQSLILPHPKQLTFLPPLIHPKCTSFKVPAFLSESPCSVHLVYPVYPNPIPLPSTDLLMSVLHCFVLPSPTPRVSCFRRFPFSVLTLIRVSILYIKKGIVFREKEGSMRGE